MYIRWQSRKRRRSQYGDWRCPDIHWSAVLVENTRVDGKPNRRPVAYLAGSPKAHQDQGPAVYLWDQIDYRRDRLGNQITLDDRQKIEAANY